MRRKGILILICVFLLSGCGKKAPDSATGFMMDTVVNVTVYDGLAAADYLELIRGYEEKFSGTIEGSDIARINASGGEPVKVSPGTIEILEKCRQYYEISKGRIDPTIGSVSKLWDFHGEGRVPDKAVIEEALTHVGFDKVITDGDTVRLTDPETELDLGFIAKGYIAEKLTEDEMCSAVFNLGGNVSVCGKKPGSEKFKIGIEKPFSGGQTIVTTEVSGEYHFVTSGIYERCFEENGRLWHHILDAKTGWPVENELSSVTVVTSDGIAADALSTTCFVLGLEEGMKLIEDTPGAEALFIDKNMNITVSSGFPEYSVTR